jgi:hypothetical protein
MDFVDEEDGRHTQPTVLFGSLDRLQYVGFSSRDGTEFDEFRAGFPGDYSSQRRLAGTRRPPQYQAGRVLTFNDFVDDFPSRNQMLLSQHFLKFFRSHPLRQRSVIHTISIAISG